MRGGRYKRSGWIFQLLLSVSVRSRQTHGATGPVDEHCPESFHASHRDAAPGGSLQAGERSCSLTLHESHSAIKTFRAQLVIPKTPQELRHQYIRLLRDVD